MCMAGIIGDMCIGRLPARGIGDESPINVNGCRGSMLRSGLLGTVDAGIIAMLAVCRCMVLCAVVPNEALAYAPMGGAVAYVCGIMGGHMGGDCT